MNDATTTDGDEMEQSESPPERLDQIMTIAARELKTVRRTRTYLVLLAAFGAVVIGLTVSGGGLRGGFGPVIVDLLLPLELLIPVVAFAFGYRAILDDAKSGELDVFWTYPLSSTDYVFGVYIGRIIGMLVAIVAPLAVVGLFAAATPPDVVDIYATNNAANSPIMYGRFMVLTALFSLPMLAIAIAVSAVARSVWSALALAAVILLAVTMGGDLALLGVVEWFGDKTVYAVAASPNSAYRGLILELAVGVSDPRATSPGVSVLGLIGWTVAGLAVATLGLRRD